MKLTTISTLGVVVALATASLLQGNDGLAETASLRRRRRRLTNTTTTGANTTASFNATAADLLSNVSVFLVVGSVLLETPCLYRGAGGGSGRDRYRCRHTRTKEFPSKRLWASFFGGISGCGEGLVQPGYRSRLDPNQERIGRIWPLSLPTHAHTNTHTHTHTHSLSLCSPD